MAPAARTPIKESASEIARRYSLDDLSKARGFARRYYINALASKAYSLVYDMLPVDEEMDATLLPRYNLRYGNYRRRPYFLKDIPVLPRRNLPTIAARMLYDRKLADEAIERREALKRAESVISRYYSQHDPLALLDMPEDELDLDDLEDDHANEAAGPGPSDKQNVAGTKDKETGTSTNEESSPAIPGVSRSPRRPRYPRLSAEAIYRILEAGI